MLVRKNHQWRDSIISRQDSGYCCWILAKVAKIWPFVSNSDKLARFWPYWPNFGQFHQILATNAGFWRMWPKSGHLCRIPATWLEYGRRTTMPNIAGFQRISAGFLQRWSEFRHMCWIPTVLAKFRSVSRDSGHYCWIPSKVAGI
jgi:hypothetical protein